MIEEKFITVAKDLALKAGKKIMSLYNDTQVHSKKADNSIVTQADLASDKIIRDGLVEHFPNHAILTEENGMIGNKNSEWLWIVDPLDGTKAYAKKIPGFSVMIGLLKNLKPHCGVVVDPLENIIYEAIKNRGAFITKNDKKMKAQVSNRNQWNQMPLIRSTGFPENHLKTITEKLNLPLVPPINSVGIKIGLLVRQIGDIYINHHGVNYWDTVAPLIILEEAGGTFTSIDGSKLTYQLNEPYSHLLPTLASNSQKHQQIIDMLKEIGF